MKAKTLKLPYFETSAKDGTNVNEAFLEMGRRIIKRRNEIGTDGVVGSRLVNSNKSNIEEPTGGCSC